eukprot:gene1933-33343_t
MQSKSRQPKRVAGDSALNKQANVPLVFRRLSEPEEPRGTTAQLAGASHTGYTSVCLAPTGPGQKMKLTSQPMLITKWLPANHTLYFDRAGTRESSKVRLAVQPSKTTAQSYCGQLQHLAGFLLPRPVGHNCSLARHREASVSIPGHGLDSSYSKRSPDEVLSKSQRQKIDRLAATHEWVVFCVVFVLTTASLVIPCYVISNTNAEPIASITLLMISGIF